MADYGMYEESDRLCSLSDKGEYCLPLFGEIIERDYDDAPTTPGVPCNGSVTFTETSGSFSDGVGEYQNDADCSWIIAPPGNDTLAITFHEFDVEAGWDFVEVYSCESEECLNPILIRTVEGAETVISLTGKAKITFTSDEIVTGDGFEGTWGPASTMLNVGVKANLETLRQKMRSWWHGNACDEVWCG